VLHPSVKSWRGMVGSGAALAAMVTAIFLWQHDKSPHVSPEGSAAGLPAVETAPETSVAEQSSVRQPIWNDDVSSELEDIESRIRGLEEEHEADK
ncbi:MAG: hypothetical protein ACK58T_25440, partial [Phycisphaerae bacterium]